MKNDMTAFAPSISACWRVPFQNGETIFCSPTFTLTVNPDLVEDSRVTLLTRTDGHMSAAVTPAVAERLGLRGRLVLSEDIFRGQLQDAGLALHGADCLFYYQLEAREALLREPASPAIRALTAGDAEVFSDFEASASEEDLDGAFVELDHWLVLGAFDGDDLASAASLYPWAMSPPDAPIADLGVLTRPAFRGKGHGRRIVRAGCRGALDRGFEPQYRCQLDNLPSIALARAAGLTLFGTWDILSQESDI